jgi:hypothetical protein
MVLLMYCVELSLAEAQFDRYEVNVASRSWQELQIVTPFPMWRCSSPDPGSTEVVFE